MREIVKGVIVIERHCCCVPFDRENYEGCSEINERVYISRNWQVLVKTILLISCSGKIFCGLMRVQKGTGKVSLRSWQYCLGARLTFWRRSCDQKREWGRRVWISISRLTPLETASPPNLTWLLQNTASYAGYWQVELPNLMSFGGSREYKTFPN